MEELKAAIGAMITAEAELAKRGYRLRWKVRVKVDRGYLRKMVDDLTKGILAPVLEPEHLGNLNRKNTAEEPQDIVIPDPPQVEAQPAEQKPEGAVEEIRPVTALDSREAASYLGMSDAGLYDRMKCGRIPVHGKPGNRWFLIEELNRYLESRKRRGLRGK
jgi:predicted DNA-binding transcriptional regulator AlpA